MKKSPLRDLSKKAPPQAPQAPAKGSKSVPPVFAKGGK